MGIILLLLIISLFIALKIFKKKYPENEFAAQLGTAILVGAIIVSALIPHGGSKVLKYTIVIFGAITFIGIVGDIINSKKKQIKS
ncbi:hypothetical protein QWT69_14485 [Sporosarcina oncorhynchi]|uniref:Holin n=1 Tax=Sporosarcina oncorhynchi TaxID=3056444 RepID=A0ABZ0L4D6_9BACL|nr:hypothetical protein [Sporosarcina sp. T2O-4]WOV87062.1 hypothetical protein QWT69_14485 [Sporosarcina sp. T2O-4]